MKLLTRSSPKYQSYILRFWLDSTHHTWRVTLQDVQSGEQRHFKNINILCQFLEHQGEQNR